MRESTVEKYLVKQIKAIGGECPKFSSPANRGVPDRIILMPDGLMVFCEVKGTGGKLSRLQSNWLEKLRALGQNAVVIASLADVDRLVVSLRSPADLARCLGDLVAKEGDYASK